MSDDQKSITSLADYIAVIDKLAASGEERRYIYRGQKDESWKVQSSALRRLRKRPLKHPGLVFALFRGYIHQIIYEVNLRYPNAYSNLTPLECMAHLQHNGVATGLIDFTYNPLVALWFACKTDGETDGKVFVVNVQQPGTIQEVTTQEDLKQELKEFFERDDQWHMWRPAVGNPVLDSQRLTVQQSVFLFGAPEIEESMIEREIIVSREHQKTILQELDRVGISEKTLFPDSAGFLERNTAESDYNAELAAHYYTAEIRKEKRREPMRENVQSDNYCQRGDFRIFLEEYSEALADYEEAIRVDPNYAVAYYNRGVIKFFSEKDYASALADYNKAIELKPDYYDAYNSRGAVRFALKEYESALADYDEAIRLNPGYAAAYNNRGNVKKELGRNAEALADYEEAIRLDPNYAEAYSGRGNVKRNLGQLEAALADYDRAISLKPDFAAAYHNRGWANKIAFYDREASLDFAKYEALKAQQGNQKFKVE